MKCPSCNHINPDTAKFCAECGTRLSHFCSTCGTVLTGNEKFCPSCGHSTTIGSSKTESPAVGNNGELFSWWNGLTPKWKNIFLKNVATDKSSNGEPTVAELTIIIDITSLNLVDNNITDITPLASLKKLIDLDLEFNQINDILPLADLKNLTNLNLKYNQITDISPLAGLKNLSVLDLGYNQITDISPLAGLNNLTELYLGSNKISAESISALKTKLPGCEIIED